MSYPALLPNLSFPKIHALAASKVVLPPKHGRPHLEKPEVIIECLYGSAHVVLGRRVPPLFVDLPASLAACDVPTRVYCDLKSTPTADGRWTTLDATFFYLKRRAAPAFIFRSLQPR